MRLFAKARVVSPKCDELQRRVQGDLEVSNFPRLRQLAVDVDADVVTLRGSVGSYYERQIAVALAERVPGVAQVVDEVNVGMAPL